MKTPRIVGVSNNKVMIAGSACVKQELLSHNLVFEWSVIFIQVRVIMNHFLHKYVVEDLGSVISKNVFGHYNYILNYND